MQKPFYAYLTLADSELPATLTTVDLEVLPQMSFRGMLVGFGTGRTGK